MANVERDNNLEECVNDLDANLEHIINPKGDSNDEDNEESNTNDNDYVELDFTDLQMNHLEGDVQVDQIDNVRENILAKLINEDPASDFMKKENVIA